MNEQNVAIVQAAYNNFKNGDLPALLSLVSDEVNWQLPEITGVALTGKRTGVDSVAEFFATVARDQDVIEFSPGEFVAQGDKVVSLGHYKWRVKETGREFEPDFAHVFTIRDGKIAAFQEYFDTAVAAAAYQKAMTA
jgi:uncharacterized protein